MSCCQPELFTFCASYLISSAFPFLLQCSSHTFSGGSDQRRAGGSGVAGLRGATRTRRRLWGWGPGRAAEETSRAQSPERSQQSPQAGAAPVRTQTNCGYIYHDIIKNKVRSIISRWHELFTCCCLTGWLKRRCANRSWGRGSGCPTMRSWRDFDESWQRGRRNALRPRRRRTRHGKHWRKGKASSSYWMDRGINCLCLIFYPEKHRLEDSCCMVSEQLYVWWCMIRFTAGLHDISSDVSVLVFTSRTAESSFDQ